MSAPVPDPEPRSEPAPRDGELDAALDRGLRRLLRARPEPAAPLELASRAMVMARAQERAERARARVAAQRLEAWLTWRQRVLGLAAGVAAAAVAAVVYLGAAPVAQQWTQLADANQALRQQALASDQEGSEEGVVSSAAAETETTSSTGQTLLIVGGLLVVSVAAAGAQRALSLGAAGPVGLSVPSWR